MFSYTYAVLFTASNISVSPGYWQENVKAAKWGSGGKEVKNAINRILFRLGETLGGENEKTSWSRKRQHIYSKQLSDVSLFVTLVNIVMHFLLILQVSDFNLLPLLSRTRMKPPAILLRRHEFNKYT